MGSQAIRRYSDGQGETMITATITQNGRIALPDDLLQAMSVRAGDRLILVEDKNGQFLLSASRRDVTALKGMFGKPARVVSIEEMNEAIRTCGAAAR